MNTTIKTRNGYFPFHEALEEARRAYLAGGKKSARIMTTGELERRRAEIRKYLTLSRIAQMTDTRSIQHAAFVQRATR